MFYRFNGKPKKTGSSLAANGGLGLVRLQAHVA